MKFVRGFWETSEPYLCFHTTPCLRKIMNTGGLYSRAYREDNFQTLGGEHDVSISAYINIQDAKNTLMFLYRVWQRYHGYLTDDMLLNKYRVKRNSMNASPHELMWFLTGEMGAKYPIVKGDEWAREAEPSDFGIVAFYNPARKAFVGWLEERGIRFLESINRRSLRGVTRRGASGSYLQGARSIEANFYSLMRGCINRKIFLFDPYFAKNTIFNTSAPSAWGSLVFGRDEDNMLKKSKHLEKDDFIFDFETEGALVEDICEYEYYEDEVRIFRPVFKEEFVYIYDIGSVLSEAQELNRGVEPLFWSKDFLKNKK